MSIVQYREPHYVTVLDMNALLPKYLTYSKSLTQDTFDWYKLWQKRLRKISDLLRLILLELRKIFDASDLFFFTDHENASLKFTSQDIIVWKAVTRSTQGPYIHRKKLLQSA